MVLPLSHVVLPEPRVMNQVETHLITVSSEAWSDRLPNAWWMFCAPAFVVNVERHVNVSRGCITAFLACRGVTS